MYSVEDENRFWSKIERDDEHPDKCWEIVDMYCNELGYGVFGCNGELIKAHRFAFQNHHNRLIKDGMIICHQCDNPSCVNPYHLFEGTHQDNMTDMINKGRGVFGNSIGEKNGMSKLTEAQVKDIRSKYNKKAKITQQVLADEYGVSRRSIGNIIKNKIWKHVE